MKETKQEEAKELRQIIGFKSSIGISKKTTKENSR
jgi:hypothetical protein